MSPTGKNHIGQSYGNWTVLKRVQMRPAKYECVCDCGTISQIPLTNLTRGYSSKCRICQAKGRSQHMIGKKYNHILVLDIEKVENKVKAKIKCDCGNTRYLSPSLINKGVYKSCGECHLSKKRKNIKILSLVKIGNKHGMITIIDRIDKNNFKIKCDCGNEKIIKYYQLQNKMPSCGCYWKNKKIQNAISYIGLKWGYLKIIDFLGMKGADKKTRAHYLLKCKCGNKLERDVGHMFDIRSCGCLQKEMVLKGENHPHSKLRNCETLTARELFKSGIYTRKDLSNMLGISYDHICRIVKNE